MELIIPRPNVSIVSYRTDFCANGLGIVMARSTLEANVLIENVVFSNNSKNALHPSVLIADDTKFRTNIIISNCTFNYNRALKILQTSKYPDAVSERHFIEVKNCFFNHGIGAGIDIHTFDTYTEIHLGIVIDSCLFDGFKPHTVASQVVSILQVQQHKRE